jgi:hypothetical protein
MNRGFYARVVSAIFGYAFGNIVYAKVNSRGFRGITSYKIVAETTGETKLVIDANEFANHFEKIDQCGVKCDNQATV